MRFVFVTTNLAGGGAEKAVLKLATALAEKRHNAEIILLENRLDHMPPENVRLTVLTDEASKGWLGKRLLARRLARRLTEPYDVLVSTLPFADEVTMLADLPRHWCRIANTLSSEVDRLSVTDPAKARRRLARYRHLYGRRPLIAVSSGVEQDLRQRIGVGGRIDIIANPFDFPAIRLAAAAVTAGLPDRPYVIHVGRLAAQKRHDVLLDAWTRVDTDRLLVLLAAPDPKLQAMIASRGLVDRVRVCGFQHNPYPWIAGADLLVLCSDHEGLPNVLIEALACGTPAISTDCPSGPREILAAFPECLVPCGDAATLAQTISRCLAAPVDPGRADLSAFQAGRVVAAYERLAGAT
jgi:glycosyltransferase involved in cell wall biosynthesis